MSVRGLPFSRETRKREERKGKGETRSSRGLAQPRGGCRNPALPTAKCPRMGPPRQGPSSQRGRCRGGTWGALSSALSLGGGLRSLLLGPQWPVLDIRARQVTPNSSSRWHLHSTC